MEKFRDGKRRINLMQYDINKHRGLFLLKNLFIFLFSYLSTYYTYAVEVNGVSLSSGVGVCRITPLRVGLQKDFVQHWCRAEDDKWPITGYWELSFYHLRGKVGHKLGSHDQLNAVTFAPVFRLQHLDNDQGIVPYLELGIGLSWFSRKEIKGRELGLNFQFEDRCSIGVRFGNHQQYDIAYRVVHFSNAYIGPCNHGLNIHFITLGYWFN